MGYLHINNLYKDRRILDLRFVFSLEKVHGTSAHMAWDPSKVTSPGVGGLTFFSGGESYDNFVKLFDADALHQKFLATFPNRCVTVFGEAYGGKQQGMSHTYGKQLCFIVFDVKIDDVWLDVPSGDRLTLSLGLEYVPYKLVACEQAVLDAERDAPSEVAVRRGITEPKPREGIVVRPTFECRFNNDERLIAKHKGDAFKETATPRKVFDPATQAALADADAIAAEWVTEMRLDHVLDKIPNAGIEHTGQVVAAMVEDVYREAAGEIVESKAAKSAIGRLAAAMFKRRVLPKA